MTDIVNLRLDFDEDGIWLIEDDIPIVPTKSRFTWGPTQLGHVSWAVIARHIQPHLEYYDMKKEVMKDE